MLSAEKRNQQPKLLKFMIQREKHLLKGLSVNFCCFSPPYVNYFDFWTLRAPATTETDISDMGMSVFVFSRLFPIHSRMVPRSPVHLGPFAVGGEHDALDQCPDGGRRRVAVPRMVQRLGKPRYLAR